MGRNLIVGDIHSRYDQLITALERANYDPSHDVLYAVGDFTDRGKDALKTLRFLMSVKNLKAVLGNHDLYLLDYLSSGYQDDHWKQFLGGSKTIKDLIYRNYISKDERAIIASWLSSLPYIINEEKYIIVHGGFPYNKTAKDLEAYEKSKDDSFLWDRDYMLSAYIKVHPELKGEIRRERDPLETDKTIFLGHTPTLEGKPFFSKEYHMVALDTGAGHKCPLTVMDMDTFEYWQNS